MVTFTCDLCNEALKKNKVALHRRCYRATFTCMDCNVTFTEKSYAEHYKCISEAERYGGANFVAKENKGEVKQQKWTEAVREAAKRLRNGQEKDILLKACKFDNMPRKQKPFINFIKSSFKCGNDELPKKVWENLQQCMEWTKKTEATAQPAETDAKKAQATKESGGGTSATKPTETGSNEAAAQSAKKNAQATKA